MSKYVRPVINAFLKGEAKRIKNTHAEKHKLYLHDNCIAFFENDDLYIQTCGWNTVTTRDRLNMIPPINVFVKKGQLYIRLRNTVFEWDGKLINITKLQENDC